MRKLLFVAGLFASLCLSLFEKIGLAVVAAFLLTQPSALFAGPLFLSARAGVGFPDTNRPFVEVVNSFGGAVSAADSVFNPDASLAGGGFASAEATTGRLHASASATSPPALFSTTVISGGLAQFDGLDVVVTGPASAPVSVSFNFEISGSFSGQRFAQGDGKGSLTLDVFASSADVGSGRVNVSFDAACCGLSFISHGSLLGYTGGSRFITSDTFMVTPGTPFELAMILHAFMFSVVGADMTLDFQNTAGFVEGQPVFNLPPGFTINSLDGTTIVDNGFGTASTATAPEPGSLALLAAGLAGLALRRRKRAS